jgi:hypothetical protein
MTPRTSCNFIHLLNSCKYSTNYEARYAVFPSLLAFSASLMQIFPSSHYKLNLQSLGPLTNNVFYSFGLSFYLSSCNSVHFNTNYFSHWHLFVLYKIMSPTFNVPPHSTYKVHVFLTFSAVWDHILVYKMYWWIALRTRCSNLHVCFVII